MTANYTTAALSGNATYTVVVSNGTCLTISIDVLVTVHTIPTINTHPTASTSICSGGTVSLSVTATNATAYQWRKDGANVTDGGDGMTANYTTAALSGNATYTVVVSNGLSACSATSSNALVTVNAKPAVPIGASANNRCGSGTVTFSATVPDGHTIDWYTASGGGSIVNGGSGNLVLSDANGQYDLLRPSAEHYYCMCVGLPLGREGDCNRLRHFRLRPKCVRLRSQTN
jgi:hypothetical protein